MLCTPVPDRRRDLVGAGICSGDQRSVPTPAAADRQTVTIRTKSFAASVAVFVVLLPPQVP
nr:hypothetical protein JVH1_4022 [Rhodococcus sp. JVH1]